MTEDLASPNYNYTMDSQQFLFQKNMEDFNLTSNFKFGDGPLLNYDDNSVLHLDNYIENGQEATDNKVSDELSTYSGNSTNCSSKYSPEYYLGDGYQNDKDKSSKIPPILKKAIHKHYEPIFDNQTWFKYEDNPLEYKRARKRIQNRESASRVRYRKKNYIEEAEQELNQLKKDNANLLLQNATLTAENNLLKQQISFLEKMIMKSNNANTIPETTSSKNISPNDDSQFILPIGKKENDEVKYDDNPNYNMGLFRTVPQHAFKKHVTLLGIVTLIICVGFISFDTTGIAGTNEFAMSQFKNNLDMAIKSINDHSEVMGNINRSDLESSLSRLIVSNTEYNNLKTSIKYVALFAYFLYFVYVCLIANWRYILRTKLKEF